MHPPPWRGFGGQAEGKGARLGGHLQTPVPKLGTRYLHEGQGSQRAPVIPEGRACSFPWMEG